MAAFKPTNRFARQLPVALRQRLQAMGVPKRKYTAVLKLTLPGRVIEEAVVVENWIVATSKANYAAGVEERIDFDPELIQDVLVKQVV
ncbi:MAG: hypothetical protein ACFCVE_07105 [Phycisphaerae bacterium]